MIEVKVVRKIGTRVFYVAYKAAGGWKFHSEPNVEYRGVP